MGPLLLAPILLNQYFSEKKILGERNRTWHIILVERDFRIDNNIGCLHLLKCRVLSSLMEYLWKCVHRERGSQHYFLHFLRLTVAQAAPIFKQSFALQLNPEEIKVIGTLSSDYSSNLLNNMLFSAFSSATGISASWLKLMIVSYSLHPALL